VTDAQDDEQVIAGVRIALRKAAAQLAAAGARDEALATFVPPRKVLFVTRKATMAPVARVWRLGVFLLDSEGTLYATGALTRAVEQGRSNHQSLSADRRREYQAAAFRGPFAAGETVNFDAPVMALEPGALRNSSGPLVIRDGRAWVRWRPPTSHSSPAVDLDAQVDPDAYVDFDAYVADRVSLLVDPPAGA
jgi:hypothetical protein